MGLDAAVYCRCWVEGRISVSPSFASLLTVTRRGSVDLPDELTKEVYLQFYRWIEDACPHRNFKYAWERIGSWPQVRALQTALLAVGERDYATLARVLTETNAGLTDPEESAAALSELDVFAQNARSNSALDQLRSAFESPLAPLRRIFVASVEGRNPVIWIP